MTELLEDRIGKKNSTELKSKINLENETELFFQIMNNLTPDWHKLILRINGQLLTNDQFFTIFDSIIDWESFAKGEYSDDRKFHAGFYASSIQLLISFYGILFSLEFDGDFSKFTFNSEFIKLLERKVVE